MALPTGYKQVEYLESTAEQILSTGFTFTSTSGFDIKCQFIGNTFGDGNLQVFGAGPNGIFASSNYGTSISVVYGYSKGAGILYDNDIHIITLDSLTKESSIDDTHSGAISPLIQQNGTFYLFGMPNNTQKCYVRIYYAKLYDSGSLVRDIIPCLDNNNVPCMYDDISGNTYYNTGTGDFLYGEIPSSSKKFRLFYTYENVSKKLRFLTDSDGKQRLLGSL